MSHELESIGRVGEYAIERGDRKSRKDLRNVAVMNRPASIRRVVRVDDVGVLLVIFHGGSLSLLRKATQRRLQKLKNLEDEWRLEKAERLATEIKVEKAERLPTETRIEWANKLATQLRVERAEKLILEGKAVRRIQYL
jgi:hypothetical protein